jgi:hypothetical protein
VVELVQQALELLQGYSADYLAHPDRDLLTFVAIGTVLFARWYVTNVTWNSKHIGVWTQKAWHESQIDDTGIKVLCSVAPFLADLLLSPYHVLRGLGLRPTLAQKVEDLGGELLSNELTLSNEKRRTKDRLEDFQSSLHDLLLGLTEQREQTSVDIPLMFKNLESKLLDLKTLARSVSTENASLRRDIAKLEEAYIESLDESVARLVSQKLDVCEPQPLLIEPMDLEMDLDEPANLYDEVIKEHDRREKTRCGQAGC